MIDMQAQNVFPQHLKLRRIAGKEPRIFTSQRFRICRVLSGEALWTIGKRDYSIGPDDVILLSNRDERIFRYISPPGTLCLFVLDFDPQLLFSTNLLSLFLHRDPAFFSVIPRNRAGELLPVLTEMEREAAADEKRATDAVLLTANLFRLLVAAYRYYLACGCQMELPGDGSVPDSLRKAMTYIHKNYDREISLRAAADFASLSPSAFSRQFKRYNGIGFHSYVTRKRMEKALYLLKNSDQTILSIASDCGFDSSSSFYEVFRKVVGVSPGSIRRDENG